MDVIEVSRRVRMLRFRVGQAYLWVGDRAVTLIDTGTAGHGAEILDVVHSTGLPLESVVLTHFHDDHVGSAAELGDVAITAHSADAAVIRGERSGLPPVLTSAFERELWDTVHTLPLPDAPHVAVHHEVTGGEELPCGATVIGLPGHTPGSIGLHFPCDRVLFTGDAIASMADGPILGVFNVDSTLARQSATRAAELDVELVCVGHGDPFTGQELRAAFRGR
jgi:glyoxylase-like metal-dependent hydrolase (beta-lactamase superfamily II)